MEAAAERAVQEALGRFGLPQPASGWRRCRIQLARAQGQPQAHRALFEYIEGYYNLRRRHSAIAYRSPRDYDQLYNHTAACT